MKGPLRWLRERKQAEKRAHYDLKGEQDALHRLILDQKALLASGEEIKPPWILIPGSNPYQFKDGGYYVLMYEIWQPCLESLDINQKRDYVERWPPTEDWEGEVGRYVKHRSG
jgi:hypothetical protein